MLVEIDIQGHTKEDVLKALKKVRAAIKDGTTQGHDEAQGGQWDYLFKIEDKK